MRVIQIILLISLYSVVKAQQPSNYYESPLHIPLLLNGSFAELRTNHFHSGVDFKTEGKTGLPVYAVADGFISRIKISPTGFGNALYIDHPNGTTSVYGHLESFISKIEEYVKNEQYKIESFDIDLTIPRGLFSVKKGEQIAWSGNSGSSAGPHLHFELRNTHSQKPVNPLSYHFPLTDHIKPKILSVMVYPVSDVATVYGKHNPQRFETVFYDGSYHIKSNPVIPVSGKTGFGLHAVDYMNGSWSKCGISNLRLKIDEKLVFEFDLDSFSFDKTRYINSFMDYEQAVKYKRKLYKTWLEPGNKLDVYKHVVKNGLLDATDGQKHLIEYEITDTYGNLSSLKFSVLSVSSGSITEEDNGLLPYNQTNTIKTDDLELIIPNGALYSNLDFRLKEKPAIAGTYSGIYSLHNNLTPIHLKCPLKIRASKLPKSLEAKALLTSIDPVSGKMNAEGGKYENGWIKGHIRSLGDYTIAIDTVPPEIIPVSLPGNTPQNRQNNIRLIIKDNFSGIASYRGTIDGQWALFEYDPRNNQLRYTMDSQRLTSATQHKLILNVKDMVGNETTYERDFYW